MTINDIQKTHEAQLAIMIDDLAGEGADSDWALVRALVHKAVHLAANNKAGEYCKVVSLMTEMINHAHELLHPGGAAH